MSTARELLNHARDELAHAGIESPRLNAEIMLAHALGLKRGDLPQRLDGEVSTDQLRLLDTMLQRRLRHEPVDYIVGWREFYGRRFAVRPGVLIPRPETETIVDVCKKRLARDFAGLALDLGCGSGCLAITLALEFTRLRVAALDVSATPTRIAAENARTWGVSSRVWPVRGDWLGAVAGRPLADLIVANPPYVAVADAGGLQAEVRDFEPHEALFGGQDGTSITRRLLPEILRRLKPGALALIEFGAGQGAELAQAAADAGYAEVEIVRDLAGLERVLVLRAAPNL